MPRQLTLSLETKAYTAVMLPVVCMIVTHDVLIYKYYVLRMCSSGVVPLKLVAYKAVIQTEGF